MFLITDPDKTSFVTDAKNSVVEEDIKEAAPEVSKEDVEKYSAEAKEDPVENEKEYPTEDAEEDASIFVSLCDRIGIIFKRKNF